MADQATIVNLHPPIVRPPSTTMYVESVSTCVIVNNADQSDTPSTCITVAMVDSLDMDM